MLTLQVSLCEIMYVKSLNKCNIHSKSCGNTYRGKDMNNKDAVISYWLNVKNKEKERTTEMGLSAQPPVTGKR